MLTSCVNYFLIFFTLSTLIPALVAEYGDDDKAYWDGRMALSRERILKAYNPDPSSVVHHINQKTQEALEHHIDETTMSNTTNGRRSLRRRYNGPCLATNPIDRCWRCDANWAKKRKKYADCAQGFGIGAVGGRNGPIYVVTDPSDNDMVNPKPGTLRHAVTRDGPLWIVFKRDMMIRLSLELIVSSHKTIDGRGRIVHISGGAGITLQNVQNVIITNIRIHNIYKSPGGMIRDCVEHFGFRTEHDGDAISVFGSHDIWIDHLSMFGSDDGLIDAVMGSTAITISNCHFVNHDKVLLFGGRNGDDIDSKMQITLAYNHFGKNLVQRMPRVRRGFVHLVNNDYTHWMMYAIGGSHNATIISQGNRYVAPDNIGAKVITNRILTSEWEWKKWTWVSDRDELKNGAIFIPSGDPNGARKFIDPHKMRSVRGSKVRVLTQFSGHITCKRGSPC
jgi:pectate lyase